MTEGIVAALVAFQRELPTVGKTSQANIKPGFAYAYADLADVSNVLVPALARQGIAYTASIRRDPDGYTLHAALMHTSRETIESDWPIPAGTPQAMGSAITYGRRYCLLAMTGVHPAGEDDDAAAAHKALAADTVDTGGRKAQRGKPAPEEDLWATATPAPAQPPDTTPKAAAVRRMREDLRNTPDLATNNQLQAMHTLFALLGVDERADKLALSEAIIGHWVDSSRDLLATEATTLVNTLRDMTRQEDPVAAVDALIEREPKQRPIEDVPLPEPT